MSALEYFYKLCSIPHRSYHTQAMREFLCAECERLGFRSVVDEAGNIYATKYATKPSSALDSTLQVRPKVCLQAHYDMVGVGAAGEDRALELVQDGQFLRAKDSSLGADNGAAIAAILWCMERGFSNFEVLLTNDEEVGLCGANALTMPIQAPFLLNLDSEVFGEVIVGCAGGFDALCSIAARTYAVWGGIYVESFGFSGGHSGVDIHKNIKSSLAEFFAVFGVISGYLSDKSGLILTHLLAGEKSNSIAVGLRAQAAFSTQETARSFIECMRTLEAIKHIDSTIYRIKRESSLDSSAWRVYVSECAGFVVRITGDSNTKAQVLGYELIALARFVGELRQGVWERDEHSVLSSLNVALARTHEQHIDFSLKARANKDDLLESIRASILEISGRFCQKPATISGFYAPWQRQLADNHPILRHILQAFEWRHTEISEIHAGLECGILQERFAQMGLEPVLMASIGPTILSPHSTQERLDIGSFEEFVVVLCRILKTLD